MLESDAEINEEGGSNTLNDVRCFVQSTVWPLTALSRRLIGVSTPHILLFGEFRAENSHLQGM